MNILSEVKTEILDDLFSEIERQVDTLQNVKYRFSKFDQPQTTSERMLTKQRLFLIILEKLKERYKEQTAQFVLDHTQRILSLLENHAHIHWSEYTLQRKVYECTQRDASLGTIELTQQKQFPPNEFVLRVFHDHFKSGHIASAQMAEELAIEYIDAGYEPLHQKQYKKIFVAAGYTWTKDRHGNSRLQGVIVPPTSEPQNIPEFKPQTILEQPSKSLSLRECLELPPVTLDEQIYAFCKNHNLFLGEIDLKIYTYANALKDPNYKDRYVYIYPMLSDDVVQSTYPELWILLLELRNKRYLQYSSVSNSSLHVVDIDTIVIESKEERKEEDSFCELLLEDTDEYKVDKILNLKDTGHNTDFLPLENNTTREENFGHSESEQEQMRKYKLKMIETRRVFGLWADKHIKIADADQTLAYGIVYLDYLKWCRDNQQQPITMYMLGVLVREKYQVKRKQIRNGNEICLYWIGLTYSP